MLGALALLILIIIVVQIVLWTSLPRTIVIKQIEQQLGLRASASSVSTGWFGHTTLHDVTLSLPLAKQSVLEVPTLKVEHNWLPSLLLGYPLKIEGLTAIHPKVQVWQNPDGQWNVTEFAQLLTHASGQKPAQQAAAQAQSPTDRPVLPNLDFEGAVILVTDKTGRTITIEPLTVHGVSAGPLVWKYNLAVPGHVAFEGRVVPGGNWQHQTTIDVKNIHDWIAPWYPSIPAIVFSGDWKGQLDAGQVDGRLQITKFVAGVIDAQGALAVTQQDGKWSVAPQKLTIAHSSGTDSAPKSGKATAVRITTVGGALVYDGSHLAAEHLQIAGLGGRAQIDGQYTLAAGIGKLSAVWESIHLPSFTEHSGSLDATLSKRLDGGPQVQVHLASTGQIPGSNRSWNGKFAIAAQGPSWDDTTWQLTTPALTLKGRHEWNFAGLTADARIQQKRITLDSIGFDPASAGAVTSAAQPVGIGTNAGPREINGNGWYDRALGTWAIRLDGQQWPLPLFGGEPMSFHLQADGKPRFFRLDDGTIRVSNVLVQAVGDWEAARPSPIDIKVTVTRRVQPPAVQLIEQTRAENAGSQQPELLTGTLSGSATVKGTLKPLELKIAGKLTGDELLVRGRKVGNLDFALRGGAHEGVVSLNTHLDFLKGAWDLGVYFVPAEETTTIGLSLQHLPLAEVGQLLGQPGLGGQISGKWQFYLPELKADLTKIHLAGELVGKGVRAPEFATEDFSAKTTIENGRLLISPIHATDATGGTFDATATMDLAHARRIDIAKLRLKNWLVPIAKADALLTLNGGSHRITIDLPNAKSTDPAAQKLRINTPAVWLDTGIGFGSNKVMAGMVHVVLGMNGRTADVREVRANLFGGEGYGYALVDFDHPLLVASDVRLTGVDAAQAALIFPQLKGLSGHYDFSTRLYPAKAGQVPDALEPLVMDINLDSRDGHYNGTELGDGKFRVFLNLDPHWGLLRAVLEDEKAPSIPPAQRPGYPNCPPDRTQPPETNSIYLGGGIVKLWGRVVRFDGEHVQPGPTSLSTHVRVAFKCVDLNQVVHAFDKTAAAMPGMLDGQVLLWGATGGASPTSSAAPTNASASAKPTMVQRLIESLHGQGAVELHRTDLANFSVISTLYNIMHIGGGGDPLAGHGNVAFRIESNTLDITSMHYFNRGIEVRAQATVKDLKDIPDSPLSGIAFGSARLFKNVDLPLIGDLDKLLSVIQTNTAPVMLGGTVRTPAVTPVPFKDIGQGFREFLMGDIKSEVQGSAGR